MAPVTPVRPPPGILTPLIGAAALPGVASGRLRRALEEPDPRAALEALARSTARDLGETDLVRARGWARRALQTIRQAPIHVLLPGDPAYPDRLMTVSPPPCPLFARGRLELLETPIVAVVGTRRSSRYGRNVARRIAGGLAAADVTVISGLADGIDGIAHRAAGLSRTIGVLGCGIDVAYPAGHRALQSAIGREGLLLTEQLPGTAPFGPNFPRRNRIIAGLSLGVVVVEAPEKSGALSTAAIAREHGADVFAVPGPITEDRSVGANGLIRDGAVLVTGAREVLQKLELPLPPEDVEEEVPPVELEGQGLALWRALDAEPRHIDEISATVGLDSHRSLASLLSLEVQGHARQLPGLRFVRA